MRTIAHIINPVAVPPSSDLHSAQPVTFETMRRAKQFCAGEVSVELLTAQFPEDQTIIPDYFHMTVDLERSILDLGTFQKKRKLPILKDVLDRLYSSSEAEYFVYTNVDIALMPFFYQSVNVHLDRGYDAIVINRRTVDAKYNQPEQIPLMYSQVGRRHPGHDCFVFRRDQYPLFELGDIIVGAPWIGRALLLNMAVHATRFKVYKKEHMTFHLGDDQVWKRPDNDEFKTHNRREMSGIVQRLEKQYGPLNSKPAAVPYMRMDDGLFDQLRRRLKRRRE